MPFLICKTYGLIGYMRLVIQEHTGTNLSLISALYVFSKNVTDQLSLLCNVFTQLHTRIPVIESHPDNALEDLRLDQPFDELRNHLESYDLDSMEKKVHNSALVLLHSFICQCESHCVWFFLI